MEVEAPTITSTLSLLGAADGFLLGRRKPHVPAKIYILLNEREGEPLICPGKKGRARGGGEQGG